MNSQAKRSLIAKVCQVLVKMASPRINYCIVDMSVGHATSGKIAGASVHHDLYVRDVTHLSIPNAFCELIDCIRLAFRVKVFER